MIEFLLLIFLPIIFFLLVERKENKEFVEKKNRERDREMDFIKSQLHSERNKRLRNEKLSRKKTEDYRKKMLGEDSDN